MIKNLMWQMFKNTGNIEYFMQYRDVTERKPDFMTEAGSETALDGEHGVHQNQRSRRTGSRGR